LLSESFARLFFKLLVPEPNVGFDHVDADAWVGAIDFGVGLHDQALQEMEESVEATVSVQSICLGPWMIAEDFNIIYKYEDKNNAFWPKLDGFTETVQELIETAKRLQGKNFVAHLVNDGQAALVDNFYSNLLGMEVDVLYGISMLECASLMVRLDISKAFDSLGFGQIWRDIISGLLSTSSTCQRGLSISSILVVEIVVGNGSATLFWIDRWIHGKRILDSWLLGYESYG
ncbi:hypothetical protein ACJX0J_026428, partial [Zea mays]